MTCNPHPTVMIAVARQRQAEFRAEADRFRLAKLGRDDGDRRQPWFDLRAVVAAALALLLTAGAAVAQDGSPQTRHQFEPATHQLAEGASASITVQQAPDAAS